MSEIEEDYEPKPFLNALTELLNSYSMENGSNTHDFILAKFLYGCLNLFDEAVLERNDKKARRLPSQIEIEIDSEKVILPIRLAVELYSELKQHITEDFMFESPTNETYKITIKTIKD